MWRRPLNLSQEDHDGKFTSMRLKAKHAASQGARFEWHQENEPNVGHTMVIGRLLPWNHPSRSVSSLRPPMPFLRTSMGAGQIRTPNGRAAARRCNRNNRILQDEAL